MPELPVDLLMELEAKERENEQLEDRLFNMGLSLVPPNSLEAQLLQRQLLERKQARERERQARQMKQLLSTLQPALKEVVATKISQKYGIPKDEILSAPVADHPAKMEGWAAAVKAFKEKMQQQENEQRAQSNVDKMESGGGSPVNNLDQLNSRQLLTLGFKK
jgi:hypothetical protein